MITLKLATDADRPAIDRVLEAFPDDYLYHVLQFWLPQRPGGLYLALRGGRPVGLGSVCLRAPGQAWLRGLRVRPDCQGRGTGTAVVAAMAAAAREQGARVVRCAVYETNHRSHRLVVRLGFVRIGCWRVVELPAGLIDSQAARCASGHRWRRATIADLAPLSRLLPPGGLIGDRRDFWQTCSLDRDSLSTCLTSGTVFT